MRTGLITFYHIHHYGAALQAAATERAVEALGHSCEIIDYYVNQSNALFRPPTSLGGALADTHTALHYQPLRERKARFERFAQEHLRITPRRYASLSELKAAALPYDVLLSGSDQIWNPRIFPDGHFDPVFFGAFSEKRRIAYAPSFGIPRIPEGMEEELRGYLRGFSHLSVREAQGQRIVQEISRREVPVVLDPTLLLTGQEWSRMASQDYLQSLRGRRPFEAGRYILCYCISRPAALEPYLRAFSEKTGLPVIQLCGVRRRILPGARCVLDAGPAEFLELFSHAAFVFTNSFHGTVFSLQFQVPFFTSVSPAELAEPEASRTFSLLSRLGLADRVVGQGATAGLEDPIDFSAVSARLEEARRDSLAYLRAALDNAPWPPEKEEEEIPDTSANSSHAGVEVPRLSKRSRCTGCTACFSVCPQNAITMARDREGFAYPSVDRSRCVLCGRCTAVCPALHPREARPLPAAFAAWNRNQKIRRESTSGGVFTALAERILESGGVVYGAALDRRQHLRHVACFSKEELSALRGAKYVQSDLGETFREIREALKKRPVLFSGTPCQVDGLYRFLGSRPENLTTCDLVCHGVPSPAVWEAMARSLERRRRKPLRSVRFRDKVAGWKNSYFTAIYQDGTMESAPLFSTGYGRAFGRALFLRPCCHHCAYTNLNRPGDFTLGDFWGLGPEELTEQQAWGVSLLLVNTAHGSYLFDQLDLGRQAFPIERAVAGNPRLASPLPPPADRAAFFSSFALEPFERVRKRFCTVPPLPVRLAGKALSPELKEKLRRKRNSPPDG